MTNLTSSIMEWAEALPEATPIRPNSLIHLGRPPAIRQALSRLVRRDVLIRIYQGIYMRTFATPYGRRAPYEENTIRALAAFWGETITPNGGAAANMLGLCRQNVVMSVYWTSGPNRRLNHGGCPIILRHVPHWKLAAAEHPAGQLLRALAWIGPSFPGEIEEALAKVVPGLANADREEFASLQGVMPAWLARPVSKSTSHG